MKIFYNLVFYILIIICSCQILTAQANSGNPTYGDSVMFRLGLVANLLDNNHIASFSQLPGIPNQNGNFPGGTALGMNAGLYIEKPLSKMFSLQLRLCYSTMNVSMKYSEFIGNQQAGTQLVQLYSDHQLDTKLAAVSAMPVLGIYPIEDIPLRFSVGFDAAFLIQKTFTQSETLDANSVSKGFTFSGNSTSRNPQSGTIPSASPFIGSALIGASWDFALSQSLILAPEVAYSLNVNNIVTGISWKVNSLKAGVTLSYTIRESPKKIVPPPPPPLPPPMPLPIVPEAPKEVAPVVVKNEMPDEQEDSNKVTCAYIIYISSANQETVNNVFELLKKHHYNDLSSESWIDKDNNKTYFRVRSKCYPTYDEAFDEIDLQRPKWSEINRSQGGKLKQPFVKIIK